MTISSTILVAFDALRAHKGRSALTSLGIVIGVASVIALVSAGEGARNKLDDRLASIGKSIIIVRAGSRTNQMAVADFVPLTAADADAIRRQVGPLLVGVAEVQVTQRVAASRYAQSAATIVGSSPEIQPIRGWEMANGRFYSAEDLRRRASVCMLGETVRKRLFPDLPNPVGQSVRIDRTMFRVIGILAPKGRSATGADQDDQVFVPITTLQHRLAGEEKVNLIVVAAKDEGLLPRAQAEIDRVLRQRHKLKPDAPADFDVSSVQELAQLAVMLTATLQGLSAVIASVSLLVGGVGVMNIMLVAVTERTREIGLRMAVGAKPADVLLQFLGEAVMLALLGGLIGVTLGLGGAGVRRRAGMAGGGAAGSGGFGVRGIRGCRGDVRLLPRMEGVAAGPDHWRCGMNRPFAPRRPQHFLQHDREPSVRAERSKCIAAVASIGARRSVGRTGTTRTGFAGTGGTNSIAECAAVTTATASTVGGSIGRWIGRAGRSRVTADGAGRTRGTGRAVWACSSADLRRSRSISCRNLSMSPVGLRPGPSAAARLRTGSAASRLFMMVLTSQTISTTTGTIHSGPFIRHPATGRSALFRSLLRTPAIEFRISVSDWRFFML